MFYSGQHTLGTFKNLTVKVNQGRLLFTYFLEHKFSTKGWIIITKI